MLPDPTPEPSDKDTAPSRTHPGPLPDHHSARQPDQTPPHAIPAGPGTDQQPLPDISWLTQALLDPTRFSIVSLLAAARWAEFGYIRDAVGITDSALSKQVTTLGRLGYIDVDKGYVGKRPRTWLRLNDDGRTALRRHIAALRQIAENADTYGGPEQTRE